MTRKRKQSRTRRITVGRIAGTGALLAVAGFAVFLAIEIARGRGGGEEVQPSPTIETRAEATPEPFQGGPRLYLPITEVDLGQIPLMENVSYSFDLVNVGDAPLVVSDASVRVLEGCCPFSPVVGSTTIEPGQKTTLSFDTHMMEGMGGPHLFEVNLSTSDPVEPLQKLLVRALFGP